MLRLLTSSNIVTHVKIYFSDDKRPLLLQILETYQSHSQSTNEDVKV